MSWIQTWLRAWFIVTLHGVCCRRCSQPYNETAKEAVQAARRRARNFTCWTLFEKQKHETTCENIMQENDHMKNEKQETTSLGQEEQTTLNVRRTRIQRQWLEKLACFKKSKQQHWQRACILASCKMHLRRLAWDLATFGIRSSIDYQASSSLSFHQRILWKIAINNVAWHNVSYFSFRDYHI